TLANAMDVGDPSNWVRIQTMFDNDLGQIREMVSSYTYSDEQTKKAMDTLFTTFGYIACPHTAIAYLAANAFRNDNPGEYASVFLSTAHPCKFPDAISSDVFEQVQLPKGAEKLNGKPRLATEMEADYEAFKDFLLKNK